jgi:hypothetical protein
LVPVFAIGVFTNASKAFGDRAIGKGNGRITAGEGEQAVFTFGGGNGVERSEEDVFADEELAEVFAGGKCKGLVGLLVISW